MAQTLPALKRRNIQRMIIAGFDNRHIASRVGCHIRAIQRIRLQVNNGIIRASKRVGRRQKITAFMLKTLLEHLAENTELYCNGIIQSFDWLVIS
jgi:transposase